MGNRWQSQSVRRKYAFIKAHRREFDTAVMCRFLGVSRSGFYQWLRNPLSNRAVEDQRLLDLIRAPYTASHGIYGAPRIFLDLREAGETCSKHRVARIMRANNLKARYGYRAPRSTRSPTSLLTPNTLQRRFTVPRPNTAWVTDITYVRTWEGWLYVAVVMDLYSRRIVGWSTKPTLAQDLVLDALLMAVRRRKPQHVLIHSDQGSQFGSDAWRRFCRAHYPRGRRTVTVPLSIEKARGFPYPLRLPDGGSIGATLSRRSCRARPRKVVTSSSRRCCN